MAGTAATSTDHAADQALATAAPVTISSPPSTLPGGHCCVTVTVPPPGYEFSYSVELGGKPLPVFLSRNDDGSYMLCFSAPAGSGGEEITVTASSGGSSASASISVL